MKTHAQLMAAYEKAAAAYHKTKPGTQKAYAAGQRMQKAADAVEGATK